MVGLSPYLLTIYLDELLFQLSSTRTGCMGKRGYESCTFWYKYMYVWL